MSGNFLPRFYGKINLPDDDACWEWAGGRDHGYGRISKNGTSNLVHRISYEHFYGVAIPAGLLIDHICRNRGCVRPDHLRLVTPKINVIENSSGWAATHISKTHCPMGHEYNKENTYHGKGKSGRHCRQCHIRHQHSYIERRSTCLEK